MLLVLLEKGLEGSFIWRKYSHLIKIKYVKLENYTMSGSETKLRGFNDVSHGIPGYNAFLVTLLRRCNHNGNTFQRRALERDGGQIPGYNTPAL
jgi:hypothetical protein